MMRTAACALALLAGSTAGAESFTFEVEDPATRERERVRVEVWRPPAPAAARPGLIYLTGCDGSTQDSTGPIFEALRAQGYVIARVDSLTALWGRRARACVGGPAKLSGAQRAEDAYRARDGLVQRGLVTEDNVALLGYSHGGWTISHAMFLDPTPGYDTARTVPFAAAVAMYPWCQTNDSPTFRNRTPTLLLGGGRDEWTHFSRCRALARAVAREQPDPASSPPLELHLYEQATHSWDRALPGRWFATGGAAGAQYLEHDAAVTADSVHRAIAWVLRHTRR